VHQQLAERIEPHHTQPRLSGDYVVYWCRIAVRAFENPALEVALSMAQELGKPMFVYHALSPRYRYASDRIHTFILEGARDLSQQCRDRNIGYAFHLPTGRGDENALLQISRSAALVVTDFMPVEPLLRWDQAVCQVAPLWRVDASCVAPIWLGQKSFERAFEFTKVFKSHWDSRLDAAWAPAAVREPNFLPVLPFKPVDLQQPLGPLVAACDIDHSIGPVVDTPGGSAAASARWQLFQNEKLGAYASHRNNPLAQGVSRLSSALHFGFISPFQMAREAKAHRTEGAKKFLDELLTWRELAWNFCLHHPQHESLEVLPAWAQRTLLTHETDARDNMYSWDTLSRGQTDDALWNAAQRQLLTHGEMHNNVRMTWGKALLSWTVNPRQALAMLFDLNNRYALDGRDPASAGGILWCLGLFDRPFAPETRILGCIRPRPLEAMAKRFDVAAYGQRTRAPAGTQVKCIAVIGAGMAGTAAARALVDAGHSVKLYDKGQRAGGRLATRKIGTQLFDMGAQNFEVSDERFARAMRSLYSEKLLRPFQPSCLGESVEHPFRIQGVQLSPLGSMAETLTRLQRGLEVHFQRTITSLSFAQNTWKLRDPLGQRVGEFDAVVLAVPAPQATTLLEVNQDSWHEPLRNAAYLPCWTLMLEDSEISAIECDISHLQPPLMRATRRSASQLVVHASPEWSAAHLEVSGEEIAPVLLDCVRAATGLRLNRPSICVAHRWRFAFVKTSLEGDCRSNHDGTLVVCGDFFRSAGVQGAYLSGQAAAGVLLRHQRPEAAIHDEKPERKSQMTLW
jgi:photolyase PhrII